MIQNTIPSNESGKKNFAPDPDTLYRFYIKEKDRKKVLSTLAQTIVDAVGLPYLDSILEDGLLFEDSELMSTKDYIIFAEDIGKENFETIFAFTSPTQSKTNETVEVVFGVLGEDYDFWDAESIHALLIGA